MTTLFLGIIAACFLVITIVLTAFLHGLVDLRDVASAYLWRRLKDEAKRWSESNEPTAGQTAQPQEFTERKVGELLREFKKEPPSNG